jgi:hypothetical protein
MVVALNSAPFSQVGQIYRPKLPSLLNKCCYLWPRCESVTRDNEMKKQLKTIVYKRTQSSCSIVVCCAVRVSYEAGRRRR